jgi:hypothetical protein
MKNLGLPKKFFLNKTKTISIDEKINIKLYYSLVWKLFNERYLIY